MRAEADDFDREFKRRNLEASHALGMAHIFERRGEFGRAVEMIDLAKMRTPFNYLAFAAAGRGDVRGLIGAAGQQQAGREQQCQMYWPYHNHCLSAS